MALDGIRGVAVFMVLVFHFWQSMGSITFPKGVAGLFQLASIGQKGVDLFFVLSGFLITGILLRTKSEPHYFRTFYIRRALRIFPLYYGVVIFCLIAGAALSLSNYQWKNTWWYLIYLQNIVMTFCPDTIAGPGHFWSLAVEEHFYLFWPLVVWTVDRRSLLTFSVALIGISLLVRIALLLAGTGVFFFTLCRMDALAFGAILAVVYSSPSHWQLLTRWTRRLIVPISLAAFASFFTLSGSGLNVLQTLKYPLFALLCGGFIVLALSPSTRFNVLPALTASRPLRAMGKISYAMYVFHPFVYGLFIGLFRSSAANTNVEVVVLALAFEFMLVVAATVVVASLSWTILERPLLRLKERYKYSSTCVRPIVDNSVACRVI